MASFAPVDPTWNAWSTTCGTASATVDIWYAWTNEPTCSTTAQVWDNWTQAIVYSTSVYSTSTGLVANTPPPLTEEQIRAQAEAAEARAAAAAARAEERVLAQTRARTLLLDALAEEQQEELIHLGYFHVETREGTRRYQLSPNGQPRRVRGEDGKAWVYCIHPDYGYPQDDVVLAQKLLLEADEEEFLRIANARAAGSVLVTDSGHQVVVQAPEIRSAVAA